MQPAQGMSRLYLAAALLAGCGFSIPGEALPPDADDDGDAAPPAVARKCATTDPSLRLCIDFEDVNTLTGDGSGRGHDAVVATALSVMPRDAEQAVLLSADSRLLVAEHVDLDIPTALTTAMWIRVDEFGRTMWFLDNNRQFSMSYQADGQLRCGLGTDTVDSLAPIWDDAWHHVACTYDGTQLRVFLDGSIAGCRDLQKQIAIDGTEGVAIGANVGAGQSFSDHFVGGLDNLQVLASSWSAAQICAAAGQTSCWDRCPVSSGGGRDDD